MISYCPVCGKPVYFAERKRSLGKDYHPLCLKCYHCKRQLSPGQHAEHDDKPYCTHCYLQRFGPRGTRPSSTTRSSFGASPSPKVPAEIRKGS
ncbi:cysteine-rich protein 1-like [Podarcis muralis]|uniref:Cysteine-rich protein 1 n=1 Tax=Podarcis muralis TaxID=64176 RepID=A0A670K8E4_PODMU|nr:cysteine-rich protein 1-like [Podarcis muralis]